MGTKKNNHTDPICFSCFESDFMVFSMNVFKNNKKRWKNNKKTLKNVKNTALIKT